mgnify:CR=1 FL=1
MNTDQLGVHAPVVLLARRLKMGRSGGCCLPANCTAPPCPDGSCCYVDTSKNISTDTFSIDNSLNYSNCEEDVTENCCLTKPFSLFNKGVECGQPETCEDQSSFTLPSVYSTDKAFILLKQDGTVVAWGDSQIGGQIPSILQSYLTNIVSIYTNPVAVVAVSKSGHAFTWGDISIGSGSGSTTLFTQGGFITYFENIKSVTGSARAFAAIRTDGTVVAWGEAGYGGVIPSSISSLLVNIVEIVSTDKHFAARDEDGKIFIWGDGEKSYDKRDVNKSGSVSSLDALNILNFLKLNGGGSIPDFNTLVEYEAWIEANPEVLSFVYKSSLDVNKNGTVSSLDILMILNALSVIGGFSYDSSFTDVKKIYSNNHAFAFLKNDGKVFVWGDENKGGNTGGHQPSLINIKEIYNTDQAFLAHRIDNKIVVWGDIDTNVGSASTFYDEVLDVVASKYAFGISYITVSIDFSGSTDALNQYFDVIGSVVDGKQNLAEKLYFGEGNFSRYPSTTTTKVHIGSDFIETYSGPYDHNNPPLNTDGDAVRFKRDFYASDYAFHFNDVYNFYLIGQSPDDEHNSHTLKYTGLFRGPSNQVGNFSSDNFRLVDHPALYDKNTETLNSVKVKNSKNYVSSSRATAFLVDGSSKISRNARTREGVSRKANYVVSLGHSDYGGLGTSLLDLYDSSFQNPIGNKGDFVGLFSNQHSFCGIRFFGSLEYEIVTWGNQDFGGDSSSVDFSDAFINTSNLKITHEGCHDNFCDQDF